MTKPPLDPEDIGLKLSLSNLVSVSLKTCGPSVNETSPITITSRKQPLPCNNCLAIENECQLLQRTFQVWLDSTKKSHKISTRLLSTESVRRQFCMSPAWICSGTVGRLYCGLAQLL